MASGSIAHGQIALWNFQDTVVPTGVAANMSAANATLSAGTFGYQNGTDDGGTRIGNSASWNQGNFATSGKYIQFSVTPNSGYNVELTSVTIRLGRTAAGPQQFTAQYSLDGFATAGTSAGSGSVASTSTASLNSFTLSVPSGAQTGTITFRVWGHNASGTGNFRFNNFRVFGTVDPIAASPSLTVIPSSLDFGTIAVNAAEVDSYSLSGADLTPAAGDITVTAPTGYGVSTSLSGPFYSSIDVAYSGGTLASTTIYVEFEPTAETTYSGNISNAGGGATTQNVAVTGEGGAATLTLSESTLDGFFYAEGAGPSAEQTYTLSGEYLQGSGNITVTAPANFQISTTSSSGFGASVNVPFAGGEITGQPVTLYVRMAAGLSTGPYSGSITHSGGGVSSPPSVSLSGTVLGMIVLSGTSYSEDFDALGTSLPNGFRVTTGATISLLGSDASFSTSQNTWANTGGDFKNLASATGLSEASDNTAQNNSANRALGVRTSAAFGDPGAAFVISIADTLGFEDFELDIDLMMLSVQGRSQTWTVDYRVGNSGNFTSVGTWPDPDEWGTTGFIASLGSDADNQADPVFIRVVALSASTGAGSRDTIGIDNLLLTYNPTIPPGPSDATWNGAGSDNNAQTGANWAGGEAPDPGTTHIMRFAGSTRTSPVVDYTPGSAFGSIYFNDGSAAFTLSGNALTLHELIRNDSANLQTLGNPFTLGANVTVNAAAGQVVLGGAIGGSHQLIKSGSETLTLNGNSTFTGGLQLNANAGLLEIGHANALGSGGALTIAGGNNSVDNSAGNDLVLNNGLTLSGGSFVYDGSSHALEFQGAVHLAGQNRRVTVEGNELILSGNVGQDASNRRLSKWGDGTMTLSGNNTHNNGTTLNEGTLNINSAGALGTAQFWVRSGGTGTSEEEDPEGGVTYGITTFDNTSGGLITVPNVFAFDNQEETTFAGSNPLTISGSGTLRRNVILNVADGSLTLSGNIGQHDGDRSFTKRGSGTLVLSGANNFLGGMFIEEGAVRVPTLIAATSAQPLGTSQAADAVRLGASGSEGRLAYTGGDASTTKRFTVVAGGTGVVEIEDVNATLTSTEAWTGSGILRKSGPGRLVLQEGTSDYTGKTWVDEGVLRVRPATSLGATTETEVLAGAAIELLPMTSAGVTYEFGSSLTLRGPGIGGTGALRSIDQANVIGDPITLGAGTIAIGVDASTLSITGLIGGAGGLEKVGGGELNLAALTTNDHTYAGATTIRGGTLAISHDRSLGVPPGSAIPGHLTLDGGTLRKPGGTTFGNHGFTLSSNRGITIGAGGGTFQIPSTRTLSYGGALHGAGAISKIQAGTLILSGDSSSSFTGPITIEAGDVRIESANALGNTGQGTVVNGGSLRLRNNIITAPEPLSLAGNGASGMEALYADNSTSNRFTGPITLTAHASVGAGGSSDLVLNSSTAIGGSGFNLTVARPGNVHITSVIGTGTGKLIKNDNGTLTLTANNTYTGGTDLNGGVIQISNDHNLGGSSGAVTFDGGTLRALDTLTLNAARDITLEVGGGSFDVPGAAHVVDYTEAIGGDGALTKAGAGTLDLTGANIYAGGTLISGGVLRGDAISLQGFITNNATLWMDQATHATNDTMALRGTGTFRKTGMGDLTLAEMLTHTGPTHIEEGVLRLLAITNQSDFVVFADATAFATGFVGNAVITGRISTAFGETQGRVTATNLFLANDAEIDVRVFDTAHGSVIHVTDDMQVDDRVVINLSATTNVNWFQDIVLVSHGGDTDEGLMDGEEALNWEVVFDASIPESLHPIMTNVYWRETNSGEYFIPNPGLVLDVRIEEGEALLNGPEETARLGVKTLVALDYDLIQQDAENYTGSGAWSFAKRLTATNIVTSFTNQLNGLPDRQMRFFRASPLGAWSNANGRLVSEEVYVARSVPLQPGQNWVSFPGIPDTNTVAQVFGHDLPAGNSPALATRISWYARVFDEIPTQQVWLATGGDWVYSFPPALQDDPADDVTVPLDQGVVVEIPTWETPTSFLFIGRVPTNGFEQVIEAQAFNLVSFRLPRRMHPSEMNLLESGFAPSFGFGGDMLWKFDRNTQQLPNFILYNSISGSWITETGAAVPQGYFGPDDAIIIFTMGSTDNWTWTLDPLAEGLYSSPSRFLDP